jgi:Putative ATPase subunit of terminase (gpP-like).
MAKKELVIKMRRGEDLFKSGTPQKEIAEILGVSVVTVNNWVKKYGWREKRAAESISRPQLVNKLLGSIDKLIEEVNNSDDPTLLAGLADKLSKFASTIEKLDKKSNIIDTLEVCTAFSKWLQWRMTIDPELDIALVKRINNYLDLFIADQLNSK